MEEEAKRITVRVGAAEAGERLDKALTLLGKSEGISRRKARALIEGRRVRVDGSIEETASRRVAAGQELEFVRLPPPAPVELSVSDVVWEDEHIIAINKPSGLLSQPRKKDGGDDAVSALERFLSRRDGGEPYLRLHHRLDRGTSGVLVFAKHPDANAGLTQAFREREARKVYLAKCLGSPSQESWKVQNHLRRSRSGRFMMEVVHAGGDLAVTSFRVLARSRDESGVLVEARPETGRTHQIRVHLAESGVPIAGDWTYGGRPTGDETGAGRLMLHARLLSLRHPVSGESTTIEAPTPADFESWPPSSPARSGEG